MEKYDFSNLINLEGCDVHEITTGSLDCTSKRFYAREIGDTIFAVSSRTNVITCDDWNKYYNLLYFFETDGTLFKVKFGWDTAHEYEYSVDGYDHVFYPDSLVKFAIHNNLKIDAMSYIAICKNYMEDCSVDRIPDHKLPTKDDLEKVLDFADPGKSVCDAYNISEYYDVPNVYAYSRIPNTMPEISFESFDEIIDNWYRGKEFELCDPPVDSQFALNLIFKALIYDKYHYSYLTTIPESTEQVNSIKLDLILREYSPAYRKHLRRKRKKNPTIFDKIMDRIMHIICPSKYLK